MKPRIGDRVQWTINGMDQFSVPRKVRIISDCGEWCFVEGSDTGLPVNQLTVCPNEQFTFFWQGPLSQWHPSHFVVNKVVYSCAEQYMMASKARLFDDRRSLALIMETTSPRDQKKLGRGVQGFDSGRWDAVARDFVYVGNKAKFTQNVALWEKLRATKGTLVEASPYDKIWGVGLHADDPRILRRETWQGKNWLGETLTRLRDDLIQSGY